MAESVDGVISRKSRPEVSRVECDHVRRLPVPVTGNTTIATLVDQVRELAFSYPLEHIVCVKKAALTDVL
jgi:hypothetical protein